jgi:hypothetical protein
MVWMNAGRRFARKETPSLWLALGLAWWGLVACTQPSAVDGTEGESVRTAQDALVEKAVFDQAFAIVRGIDYLPFEYKEDGCYARALYMSMELGAEGLESNALFAFASAVAPLQVGDIYWNYHVAPMLLVKTSRVTPMVIDPALSNRPLTESSWLGLMGVQAPTASGTDPFAPRIVTVPGSRYGVDATENESEFLNRDVPNFESLPPFQAVDLVDACTVMHSYLKSEGSIVGASGSVTSRKQLRLLRRTTELAKALVVQGKLDGRLPSRTAWTQNGERMLQECVDAVKPAVATP